MNTSTLIGIGAIAMAAAAGGTALVSYQAHEQHKYANVISAKLVTASVEGPREHCYEETVTPQNDDDQNAGATLVNVVDRALGRHFGRAKKNGHARGNAVAYDAQPSADAPQSPYTQQRCETVYDAEQQPAGYDVKYHYAGKSGTVHMDHDPGKRIPVENGELVLNNDDGESDNTAAG